MFYSNPVYENPYDDFYNYENTRELNSSQEDFVLKVGGLGSVKAEPDVAAAFLGVVSENKELSIAQEENALKSEKVISAIIGLGISERDIKTESFSITPEYDFVEGKQVFRSYRVSNNLQITIKNIKDVGKVIDAAVAAGANAVYNVNFALTNREAAYERALSLAVIDAVSKAKSMERTLNIRVDDSPFEIIEENTERISPRGELYSIKSPAADTTIMSGELEIIAKIHASFNYRKL